MGNYFLNTASLIKMTFYWALKFSLESRIFLSLVCLTFMSVLRLTDGEDPCLKAHLNSEACPCWPSFIGGLQSAPLSWHDGMLTHQFSCPRGLRFPQGTSNFYGNCTTDLRCLRIPPCRNTFSCALNNPCMSGKHPLRQFLHAERGSFVVCGPRGQCAEVACPRGLIFDVEHEYCTWRM